MSAFVFCSPGCPWCSYWLASVLDATAGLDVGVQFECGVLHFVIKTMIWVCM